MQLHEVEKLICNLSWDLPEEVQLSAIERLGEIDDEHTPLLIQNDGKNCWNNAVKVLQNIGYPRNRLAIPRLIWLLQDLNWPGVPAAFEVLKDINKSILVPHIENALQQAFEFEDFMWIGGIQRLVEALNITEDDFQYKEVYALLKLSDW